ncbi:MAG: NADPH:quinone oxidoreductase [Nitrosomonadaceae bacterium]|nr:NADPH:quinone oxidoreductase [Nitrosomonadaceae bacterium]|tara:strand:+ start:566 stop:1540 length:975 start_codon:yes stop_codon:yes gene_type:complete
MKVVLCKEFGSPENLVIEDIPSPKIKNGHVIITVKACGINYPDTLIIQGKYQYQPDFPFSPGAEISGVVKEVGIGVNGIAVGDRVFSFIRIGGFCEEVLVSANKVFHMPENMDFKIAAALIMTYGTSYYTLKHRAKLRSRETLLVLGAAGGIGLAAIELGRTMGARVIASASTDDKLMVCQKSGANKLINYSTHDFRSAINHMTNGKGVDVVCDPVGGEITEKALRCTGWKGRYMVMGFASGEIPKIALNLPLLKGNAVMGIFWSDFIQREENAYICVVQDLISLFLEGEINPKVSKIYPLDQVSFALKEIMQRRVIGKSILIP